MQPERRDDTKNGAHDDDEISALDHPLSATYVRVLVIELVVVVLLFVLGRMFR